LCIIKKLPPESNVLGKRIIVGTDEGVTEEWEKYNGILIQDFAMVIKDDTNLDVFELVARNNSLSTELAEIKLELQTLTVKFDEDVAEKRAILTENNRAIQALSGQVEGLTAMVAERDWSLSQKEGTINSLSSELTEIKNSRSWRLLRSIKNMQFWK
jgi:hypothetical protein